LDKEKKKSKSLRLEIMTELFIQFIKNSDIEIQREDWESCVVADIRNGFFQASIKDTNGECHTFRMEIKNGREKLKETEHRVNLDEEDIDGTPPEFNRKNGSKE